MEPPEVFPAEDAQWIKALLGQPLREPFFHREYTPRSEPFSIVKVTDFEVGPGKTPVSLREWAEWKDVMDLARFYPEVGYDFKLEAVTVDGTTYWAHDPEGLEQIKAAIRALQ